jgi:hypothetical protein
MPRRTPSATRAAWGASLFLAASHATCRDPPRVGDLMNRRSRILWGVVVVLAIGCPKPGDVPPPRPPAPQPSPFQISESPQSDAPARAAAAHVSGDRLRFREVHGEAQLIHTYQNGERGKSLMVETIGGGAGWLDFDADGRWDLYLNQGGDPTAAADAHQPNDALFHNRGDGTFENVTEQAGIREFRYSQAVCVGDYDGDGFDDVYVTNVGGNTLFHNQGDGTFQEVTERAGVRDGRWSVSAAWADLDLDGDLDLYVCNYLIYDPLHPRDCRNSKGQPRICHPREIDPWPDECYYNQGDGTFRPEAEKRGLVGSGSKTLGVAVADFNNDGWPDIFATNDTTANFLFLNDGHGQFTESALLMGCAVNADAAFQANMGIGVGDYDQNGYLDVYVTTFYEESKTLYRNLGPQGFEDVSGLMGLRDLTFLKLSFGTVMVDFDQDGRLDIFTTSGHIENFPGNPLYKMAPQLFTFNGVRWIDCSDSAGEFFRGKYVGRGVALCDYDDDGDLDIVVAHENSPVALLRNDSERGHWLKLLFRGRESNRRGIGCRATVVAGAQRYLQELCGGTSYASTHQPALVFGCGDFPGPVTVTVRWPNGRTQTLDRVTLDQTLTFDELDARP